MAQRTIRAMLEQIEQEHGAKPSEHKRVERNTLYYKIGDREFWRLHETDVVIHDLVTDRWTLSSGGWKTMTTRDRISKFAPVRICSVKGLWYLVGLITNDPTGERNGYPDWDGERVPFADGVVVDKSGLPVGDRRRLMAAEAEQKRLLGLIDKFCAKAARTIREQGKPMPGAGDCWDCSMQDAATGKPMGDLSKSDHLLSHIKEGYVHGSLLFRAVQDRGYGNPAFVFQTADAKWLTRDLRRYLKSRLGLTGPATVRR